jgi:hypothetical protein
MSPFYFDRNGAAIDFYKYSELSADPVYVLMREDIRADSGRILTTWAGANASEGLAPQPMIFLTEILLRNGHTLLRWWAASEEEALRNHQVIQAREESHGNPAPSANV